MAEREESHAEAAVDPAHAGRAASVAEWKRPPQE